MAFQDRAARGRRPDLRLLVRLAPYRVPVVANRANELPVDDDPGNAILAHGIFADNNQMPMAHPAGIMPLAHPAEMMPQAQPAEGFPLAQPAGIMPMAQPAGIMPMAQPAGIMPMAQPAGIMPMAQPAGIMPMAQPAGIMPMAQPAGIMPMAQPAGIMPMAHPAEGMPLAHPAEAMPFAHPAGIVPQAQIAGIMPMAQPAGMMQQAHPGGNMQMAHPAGIVPQAQIAGIMPMAQPAGMMQQAHPGGNMQMARPAGIVPQARLPRRAMYIGGDLFLANAWLQMRAGNRHLFNPPIVNPLAANLNEQDWVNLEPVLFEEGEESEEEEEEEEAEEVEEEAEEAGEEAGDAGGEAEGVQEVARPGLPEGVRNDGSLNAGMLSLNFPHDFANPFLYIEPLSDLLFFALNPDLRSAYIRDLRASNFLRDDIRCPSGIDELCRRFTEAVRAALRSKDICDAARLYFRRHRQKLAEERRLAPVVYYPVQEKKVAVAFYCATHSSMVHRQNAREYASVLRRIAAGRLAQRRTTHILVPSSIETKQEIAKTALRTGNFNDVFYAQGFAQIICTFQGAVRLYAGSRIQNIY